MNVLELKEEGAYGKKVGVSFYLVSGRFSRKGWVRFAWKQNQPFNERGLEGRGCRYQGGLM